MEIKVILFDLGGVLVKLGESPFNPAWLTKTTEPDFDWFSSESARLFEKGLIKPEEFANSLIDQLSLDVQATQFLEYFTHWPKGLYQGVENLLSELNNDFELAVLSNTNELHWPRLMQEIKLDQYFDYKFASHLIHKAKPEPEIFEYVLAKLNIPAEQILFLDDNPLNIEVAKGLGIHAMVVRGDQNLKEIIQRYK